MRVSINNQNELLVNASGFARIPGEDQFTETKRKLFGLGFTENEIEGFVKNMPDFRKPIFSSKRLNDITEPLLERIKKLSRPLTLKERLIMATCELGIVTNKLDKSVSEMMKQENEL